MVYKDPEGFTAAAMVPGPNNEIVVIKDPSKPTPHYWKFPRGTREGNENPAQCAARELYEETGIYVPWEQLNLVEKKQRRDHKIFYFMAPKRKSWDGLKKRGNDGEEVAVFTIEELKRSPEYMPSEKYLLYKF
jgi:8-oxo-dGTP diphosphatase